VSSFYRDDEKKRCGFIVFVIESATAGCGIPNDSMIEKVQRFVDEAGIELTVAKRTKGMQES